jgi:hypothetical protein
MVGNEMRQNAVSGPQTSIYGFLEFIGSLAVSWALPFRSEVAASVPQLVPRRVPLVGQGFECLAEPGGRMLPPRRRWDAAAGTVGGVGGELGRGQEALALAADGVDRCEDLPPPGRSSGRLA